MEPNFESDISHLKVIEELEWLKIDIEQVLSKNEVDESIITQFW